MHITNSLQQFLLRVLRILWKESLNSDGQQYHQ